MIRVRGLVKRYGAFTAVRGVDFDVERGEVFGFLGPNGAGKTTTMRMIAGLIQPTSGSIEIAGHDLARAPLKAKAVTSYIPDRPFIYEKLTAFEFLEFVGGLHHMDGGTLASRAGALLERFGLADWADSLVENFSHGMKQRLVFSAALLTEPKLLVVDEPMVGLDPQGARLVKEVFRTATETGDYTVFLSTHTLEVAEEVCDRIAIIAGGRIVALGTMAELRARANEEGNLERIFLRLTQPDPSEDPDANADGAVGG